MKCGKAWGTTETVWEAETASVHRIDVLPGGYCSRHHHRCRWNRFFVERGTLTLVVWQPSGTADSTTLRQGEAMAVPPGVDHRFETVDGCVAYEIYHGHVQADDIVRADEGGRR